MNPTDPAGPTDPSEDSSDRGSTGKRYGSTLRQSYDSNPDLAPYFHLGCAFGYAERLDTLATPGKNSSISRTRDKASRHPKEVLPRMTEVVDRAYGKAIRGEASKKSTAHTLKRRWDYARSRCIAFPDDLDTDQRSAFCMGYADAQADADWLASRRGPSVDESAPRLAN